MFSHKSTQIFNPTRGFNPARGRLLSDLLLVVCLVVLTIPVVVEVDPTVDQVISTLGILGLAGTLFYRLAANKSPMIGVGLQLDSKNLQRLAMALEHTSSAVILADVNGNVTWVNKAFSDITGYSLSEIVGQKPGRILQCEQTDPNTVEAIRNGLRQKVGFSGEILNRHKNGNNYWVYIDIQPLVDEHDTLHGFLSIEYDVTSKRRVFDELALANEQAECALDGGNLAIWQWDLIENKLSFDHRWFKVLRRSQGTMNEDPEYWLSQVHPEDRASYLSLLERLDGLHESAFVIEFRVLSDSGEYVWVLARGQAIRRSSDQAIVRLVGTIFEITDRKEAELALRKSEAEAQALFNESMDAICCVEEGVVVDCNPSAPILFDFDSREELIGKSVLEFSPEYQSDGSRTADKLQRVLDTLVQDGRCRFEWTHSRKNGTTYDVDVMLVGIKLDGVTRFYSFVRDISDRKELERKLAQAQKLESIGQLAAGVAHEINTPMQCVFSNVEYLQESVKKVFQFAASYRRIRDHAAAPEAINQLAKEAESLCRFDRIQSSITDAVKEAAEGSNRVIEIVRAMKTMAHPGTTDKVPTDVNKLIEDASIISRNRWKYIAQFDLQLSSEVHSVPLLPAQMSQVILNLIVNASDAISEKLGSEPSSLGKITARTFVEKNRVVIEIEDTGAGMPDRVKQRVFDPFFTTKEVGKGTGQGLAIAYDVIVNQHNGTIAVESVPKVGTTFRIELPEVLEERDGLLLAASSTVATMDYNTSAML